MTITVTQHDIDHGRRGDCVWCPIALAASRAIGAEVYADGAEIFSINNRYQFQAETPEEACRFMEEFDAGEPVVPFSFELEVP